MGRSILELAGGQYASTQPIAEAEACLTCDDRIGRLRGRIQGSFDALRDHLRALFSTPSFVLPGASVEATAAALVDGIRGLNRGRALELFRLLGGTPAPAAR